MLIQFECGEEARGKEREGWRRGGKNCNRVKETEDKTAADTLKRLLKTESGRLRDGESAAEFITVTFLPPSRNETPSKETVCHHMRLFQW